ncbi:MAG: hypothetical protein WA087_00885 [Candidatus Saccharimonadales bacterium]
MFLVGILSWWYGNGLVGRFQLAINRIKISSDFFSFKLLINTLFAPYKQISAGSVQGTIGDIIRAFFDRLLSRIIGAVIRTFMIIAGFVVMFLQSIYGVVTVIIWLVIPLLPIAGLIASTLEWVPSWTN